MIRLISAAAAAAFLMVQPAMALPETGKPAPDFTATDANGAAINLSQFKGKPVVIEWTNPECPFVKKHYDSGNMQRLQSYAKDKGVIWLTINSSAPGKQGALTADQAKAAGYGGTHYLLDPSGTIGKLYDAKTTPHMFVINKEGNIAYMGAIDDKPSTDIADIAGARNYVRETIEDLMAAKPIQVASTQAYGCSVKYAD